MKPKTLIQKLVDKLARREHASLELMQWCRVRGYPEQEIHEAIKLCQEKGYQSDLRFAEMWMRHRQEQGYGKLRIQQELHAKGIDHAIIVELDEHWINPCLLLSRLVSKNNRTGDSLKRWLFQRGFALKDIESVMSID